MHDSLSSLLVFIAIMCLTFTSVNGSNSRNASLKSVSLGMMCSVVVGRCYLAGIDFIVCGFSCHGPKYPLSNVGGR